MRQASTKRISKSDGEPMPPAGGDTLFVGSLEKGFRVLAAFDDNHPTLGVTEIAQRTGLDKSAAQRFSNTLHKLGYLEKDATTRRYTPARKLVGFAYTYMRHNRLAERAMPRLIDAGKVHNTTINLAEFMDTDVIYTIRIPQQTTAFAATLTGRCVPTFCTSAGLAILAHMPEADVMDILKRSDRHPYTPRTVTDIDQILRILERIRRDGFCATYGQLLPREISVAAVVFDSSGKVSAAVQIPIYRPKWTLEDARRLLGPLTVDTARGISSDLVGTPPP